MKGAHKIRVTNQDSHNQVSSLPFFAFSDNHMKISFSGIEQGFRFQGLLGTTIYLQ